LSTATTKVAGYIDTLTSKT